MVLLSTIDDSPLEYAMALLSTIDDGPLVYTIENSPSVHNRQ